MLKKLGNRRYLIEYPTNFGDSSNLIFLFHPFTWSPDYFKSKINIAETLLSRNYICVYPAGQFRSWYTAFGHRKADLDFFRALVSKIYADLSFEPRRFVVAGFSDGAYFANYVATQCPRIIDGVISVAGGLKVDLETIREPYQVLVLQGENDKLVKKESGLKLANLYRTKGYPTTYQEFPTKHEWNGAYNIVIGHWLNNL